MATFLKIIPGLLALANLLAKAFNTWKARREARKEIAGEVAVTEVKAANAVTEVMAERRPDDDAARRMRDGTF